MHRSYLFAPGHNEKLLSRVFDAGADAVMLDLEDAVPAHAKEQARTMVADALAERSAWVRINAVGTELAAADLEAIAGLAAGLRIPKVESGENVQWVRDRAPHTPLICAIETARGLMAARCRAGRGRPAPLARWDRPAARPRRERRQPTDALRSLNRRFRILIDVAL